jgi:hypothetical protein
MFKPKSKLESKTKLVKRDVYEICYKVPLVQKKARGAFSCPEI